MSDDAVAVQQELDLGSLPGERTTTSYALPAELAEPEWQRTGLKLALYSKASLWWVADWAVEGEGRWGDMATQFLDQMGMDYAKLSKLMYVARRIAPEVRRPELTFSHHEVVAQVEEPEKQEYWLARAVDEHLTRDELRALIKGKETPEPSEEAGPRAPLSKARQAKLREVLETVAARWWTGVAKDKAVEKLRKDQAFRTAEFVRLANLGVRATVKFLGNED